MLLFFHTTKGCLGDKTSEDETLKDKMSNAKLRMAECRKPKRRTRGNKENKKMRISDKTAT